MKKKHLTSKKKKTTLLTTGRRFKGGVDAGTVYGIILLSIIVGGGYLMLGDIAPKLASPDDKQSVDILPPGDKSTHPDLQLKNFNGVTGSPTPTDTPTPTPTPTTPPPAPGGGSSSGGGNNSCFVKGTKVLMADMTKKNIEDIRSGDKVMGYNGKGLTKETVKAVETPVRDHHYDIHLADGTVLGTTDDHPIYTKDGWAAIDPEHAKNESPNLPVSDLTDDDSVLKSNGKYVEITSIKYYPGNVQTYNLKDVTGYNNYYAEDVVVHNKGGGGSGGGAPAGPGVG